MKDRSSSDKVYYFLLVLLSYWETGPSAETEHFGHTHMDTHVHSFTS